MVRGLIGLATVTMFAVAMVVGLGALGFDPWAGFRMLFRDKADIEKITVDERRVQCLALEVWHTAWLNGEGNLDTALLVGVTAANAADRAHLDQCTVFEQGIIQLPTDVRAREGAYIKRSVEAVTAQASATYARREQFGHAVQIARTVLTAKHIADVVPERYRAARCVFKLQRARWGFLVRWTAGDKDALRSVLEQEAGPPVYTAPGGTVFFGMCH